MVRYTSGDIFKSPAQVITNTVNCVGVMGAGLALAFKTKYPRVFDDYKKKCEKGEVTPGHPYLYEDDQVQVLNFPTKRHWKEDSRLEDIEAGLKYLAEHHAEMGIFYLALPPLGCGLGGLNWSDVKALIDKQLGAHPDLDVVVYEPVVAKSATPDDDIESTKKDSDSGVAAQQIDLPI